METFNQQEKRTIELLRRNQPVPPSPEKLTDSIMREIEKRDRETGSNIVGYFRMISGAAAIFLIGLFVYQQAEIPSRMEPAPPIAAQMQTKQAIDLKMRTGILQEPWKSSIRELHKKTLSRRENREYCKQLILKYYANNQ